MMPAKMRITDAIKIETPTVPTCVPADLRSEFFEDNPIAEIVQAIVLQCMRVQVSVCREHHSVHPKNAGCLVDGQIAGANVRVKRILACGCLMKRGLGVEASKETAL